MDTLQAILLGIVQGITEFLPVSSSGHLQIAKELLGVELEENLTFDVALHAATVLSTIVVLWSEVWRLLKGLFSRRFNAEQAYVLKLVLSMIPIGVIGFLFKDRINAMLDAPYILVIVGAMLLLTATLLAFAYYAKPRQKETISYRDAKFRLGEPSDPNIDLYSGAGLETLLYQVTKEYKPYTKDEKAIPSLKFTDEQNETMSVLKANLSATIKEGMISFFNGTKSIDDEYDAWLATLESQGLPQLVEIYQNAYNAQYK